MMLYSVCIPICLCASSRYTGIFWYPKQILTLAPVVASGEVVASMRIERQERQPRADSSSTAVLGGVMQRARNLIGGWVSRRRVIFCETEGSGRVVLLDCSFTSNQTRVLPTVYFG